jgi:small subunit ribosomal protein S10
MKIRIILKTFEKQLLIKNIKYISDFLIKNNFLLKNIIHLPIKKKRFCVLRSPHIDKDSREHFEILFYKAFIDIDNNSIKSSLNTLLNINLDAGIFCNIKLI